MCAPKGCRPSGDSLHFGDDPVDHLFERAFIFGFGYGGFNGRD